ncbi:MAG TPA: DUF2752 domain-containing protein [Lachnospiraceae bacterium]|nr:DUF2752 domain-containing protein [Lachnospiraceae bacterium]
MLTIPRHSSIKKYTVDDILFILGWLLFLPLAALVIFYNIGWIRPTEWLPPCLFRFVTGLPCPGCGGTRAFAAVLRGDLIHAFFYHPVVPFCYVLYIVFMATQTIERILRKTANLRFHGLSFRLEYVYVAVLLILVQWIIKIIAAIV